MRRLSKEQKEDIARLAAMSDDDIDFSDIPLKLDWSNAEIGKFYRPPKKSVTMRLDADILDWLKGYGISDSGQWTPEARYAQLCRR